jgi:pimeloyl-ACP methyl ester carboxylesterase
MYSINRDHTTFIIKRCESITVMPYIHCNGADLYYEDRGEGPPIVFIHGAIAGLRFFAPQLKALSNEYACMPYGCIRL